MTEDPYHHGDLRNALVAEGLSLAVSGGAPAITVRATARRAGVSHAAAYRHFQSRGVLLASIAAEAMNCLAAELEDATTDNSPLDRLAALTAAYVSWAMSNPGIFRVAFSEELWDKEDLPELRTASDRASRPVLEAAADYLGSSAPQEEGRRLAVATWAQAHGFAVLALDRQLRQGELRAAYDHTEGLSTDAARAVRVLVNGWPAVS